MTTAADLADLAARIPAPLRVRVGAPDDLDRVVEFQNRYARPAMVVPIETVRRFETHNPQPKRLVLIVEDERSDVVAIGTIPDGGSSPAPSARSGGRASPSR